MPALNDKEFKCDFCGGTFNFIRDENWSEERAIKEFKDNFPGSSLEGREIVCDDCWEIVKPNA